MGFWNIFRSTPTPEELYRQSLRNQFISDKDVADTWQTTRLAMNLAAQEVSATKAREMEVKAIKQAKEAREKREGEDTELRRPS